MEDERWLPVVGWEGSYEVSDHGRVRGVIRTMPSGRGWMVTRRQRVMRACVGSSGYLTVRLSRHGSVKNQTVHRLVAMAFVANTEGKPAVNHRDGMKTNNTATNLEWCSTSENALHSHRVLGKCNGASNGGGRKLSEESVRRIREYCGRTHTDIARQFAVSRTLIKKIRDRALWASVP